MESGGCLNTSYVMRRDKTLVRLSSRRFQMRRRRYKQLLVLDIPRIDIGPTHHIGNQLTEPPMRVLPRQLGECGEQF